MSASCAMSSGRSSGSPTSTPAESVSRSARGLFTFVAEMGRKNYPNVSGLVVRDGPDYKAQLMNWSTLDLYSKKFLQPVYNDDFGNIVYRIK